MAATNPYTPVSLNYEQAARRARKQFGKGGAAAYNLAGCAYCGQPALATSLNQLHGELMPPADQPYDLGRIRVEVTTHYCRKHAKIARPGETHRRAVSAGTSGMIIGAVLYLLANLVGASNGVPFFTSSNIILVVVVGIVFIFGCAIAGEYLGRLTRRSAGLPPAARIKSASDQELVFEFIRPASAEDLQEQLRSDEQQVV